ncbi:unnamed protein product [Prunus armeniaca]|uniref:Uncharacterized protein n=1 Tax=Prunus armeniaca TaxID=36596 RepID=A0A6J5U317_PRUAR|nr:unnamed protein product [Prunus armeniaca]CAB4300115.1 unnamed protein product [Prunus armeniaca]
MALAAQPKNLQIENVVLNLPRNIRCNKCRNTMAKDTKINSRKEKSSGNLVRTWVVIIISFGSIWGLKTPDFTSVVPSARLGSS